MTKPKPFNAQELHDYSDEHVAYEVERLFWLAAFFSDQQSKLTAFSKDDLGTLNDTLVEGFALHFRNVFEFLYDPENRNYVVAEQFCLPGLWVAKRPEKPDVLGRSYGRANEEVAHLTVKRKPRIPARTQWPFKEIADAIRPIIECLTANAVEGRLSPRVLEAISARAESACPAMHMGVGPAGANSPHEMTPVGTTGTSRSYVEEEDPRNGRT